MFSWIIMISVFSCVWNKFFYSWQTEKEIYLLLWGATSLILSYKIVCESPTFQSLEWRLINRSLLESLIFCPSDCHRNALISWLLLVKCDDIFPEHFCLFWLLLCWEALIFFRHCCRRILCLFWGNMKIKHELLNCISYSYTFVKNYWGFKRINIWKLKVNLKSRKAE